NVFVSAGALLLTRARITEPEPEIEPRDGSERRVALRHAGSSPRYDDMPENLPGEPFGENGRPAQEERRRRTHSVPRPKSAAALLAISGCVALIYEVTWTRLLALTIGPTTYAFSAMLMAFILGLAAGAAIASRLLAYIRRPVIPLAVTQLIAALGAFGA